MTPLEIIKEAMAYCIFLMFIAALLLFWVGFEDADIITLLGR